MQKTLRQPSLHGPRWAARITAMAALVFSLPFTWAGEVPQPAQERGALYVEPGISSAGAGEAPPPARRFQPPPVPEFMLRRPARPLSHDEMVKQAEEAAEKARTGEHGQQRSEESASRAARQGGR